DVARVIPVRVAGGVVRRIGGSEQVAAPPSLGPGIGAAAVIRGGVCYEGFRLVIRWTFVDGNAHAHYIRIGIVDPSHSQICAGQLWMIIVRVPRRIAGGVIEVVLLVERLLLDERQ